jgi:hypothetical protein
MPPLSVQLPQSRPLVQARNLSPAAVEAVRERDGGGGGCGED